MFSLQQVFGKGDRFIELLEASAQEAHASAQLLIKLLQSNEQNRSLEDFVLARRRDKRILEDTNKELVESFVTGLDREDIEALSFALYRIPKTVEKFAEHFMLVGSQVAGTDFMKQAEMTVKATEALVALVKQLREIQQLEKTRELNDRLQYIEGEADKLMLELVRELYSGKHDALKVVILKDLYELMEKVIDRCRDAGNVVYHIVLKNS